MLTHAHLDHVGYLPRLVAQGFRGRVICTAGTADLCQLVLPDAGRIQEEDARQANRHGYSKHNPALPLYTESDAYRALSLVAAAPATSARSRLHRESLSSSLRPGICSVPRTSWLVSTAKGTVLFGGDLGRYGRPVLQDPADAVEADLVLVESTYGDRDHAADDDGTLLAEVIHDTVRRGGKLIIPSFAIGRVEELLYWVRRLEHERRIPVIPVYVDSPMAAEALRYYSARVTELDPEMRPARKGRIGIRLDTLPNDRLATAVERADRVETQRDRHLGERDGNWRTRIASHGGGPAGPEEHRAVRGISGRGDSRASIGRWRLGGQDSWTADRGCRADCQNRFHVRACRSR